MGHEVKMKSMGDHSQKNNACLTVTHTSFPGVSINDRALSSLTVGYQGANQPEMARVSVLKAVRRWLDVTVGELSVELREESRTEVG